MITQRAGGAEGSQDLSLCGGNGSWPGGLTSTTRTEILHHGNASVTMMA